MKIKTHKKQLLCVIFMLAMLISNSHNLFTAYALDTNGGPNTFEEFEEKLENVRTKRAELQNELNTVKEYDNVKAYQEIWDLLERYIDTEEIAEWKGTKVTIYSAYRASSFSYDEIILNELVDVIQKYDPNFRLVDDIKNNNIITSIPNISVTEIATMTYDMLYLGHIDFMLAHAQEHFDRNSEHATARGLMVEQFNMSVNEEFQGNLALYYRMAELYNRIMSRDDFNVTQAAFRSWEEKYHDNGFKLRSAMHILQNGEELTAKDIFPYYIKKGAKKFYFCDKIPLTDYTLEQLVEYLPEHEDFPQYPKELTKEETIAFFTSILEAETQNLKDALLAIDSTLTDLDDKTADELVEVGKQLRDASVLFRDVTQNIGSENQNLTNLLIDFNFKALGMLIERRPAAKYFEELLPTAYADTLPTNALSASQIKEHASDDQELLDYYRRIGNAALQIDPTITEGLYPYGDWVVPDISDKPEHQDPSVPGSNTPNNPSGSPQDPSGNPSDGDNKNDSLTPNTGIIAGIMGNATSTLGVVVIATAAFVLSAKKFLKHKAKQRKS